MAMASAQALVAELPLGGEAVVSLGKQLHEQITAFKEVDESAVLFGRRLAGLNETAELAVAHIGQDKLQSLGALVETLVQAGLS